MFKLMIKTLCKAGTFCLLMMASSHTYAALIFEFDNADIPEINFVDVESIDVHLYFGPDLLDIGDSFDLLIGATPGSSELASSLNVSFDLDDVSGFGYGGLINFTPITEQFYATIIKRTGSFNMGGVIVRFHNDDEGANFHGVAQRPENPVDVPEPSSLLLLLLALGVMWSALISNTYHNA